MNKKKDVNFWLGIFNVFGAVIIYLTTLIFNQFHFAAYGIFNLIVGIWLLEPYKLK